MTPERWERLKQLYSSALEMPVEERPRFVAQKCRGDHDLKHELDALLKANDEPTDTLDAPLLNLNDLYSAGKQALHDGDVLLRRFRIVRLLGSGGMGEVYEAIDDQLGRIALKTISPGVAEHPGQLLRFKKEVQLARKVSSPHVCRIHELHLTESGSEGSPGTFLTMEFLDGITLTDKIRESGPMPWREARKVALELCAALQSIHGAEIVHRDLKGRNIMLASRNGVTCTVLMDFGIARQLANSADMSTQLTRSGMGIGTPGYMAPEQRKGKEPTPATDIYALGVVLYELVTAKHPFPEDPAVANKPAKTKSLVRPSSIQPGVPRRFDQVVCKCLEYDPERRYQSAKEVEQAIRTSSILLQIRHRPITVAAAAIALVLVLFCLLLIPPIGERVRGILFSSREKHIAVLPLEFAGGNPETQALGDGLMDSLAGKVANLDTANHSLWVVPASEVRTRKVTDASSAMREFGATIVVKGNFERKDQAARLKLTLIDPKKTREIGYVDVNSQSGDLASLQDEAVTRLGRLMNISTKEDAEHGGGEPKTRAAYEDYLAGLGYFQRHDKPGNIELAIASLEKAVKTDPGFALGFARLSQVYFMRYLLDSKPVSLRRAEEYSRRAAELDDRIPSTYVALAQIHEMTGNHDLAIQEYQRAISLDPRDTEALGGVAYAYQNAGRNADAEAAYLKAATLRPNDWTGYNDLGIFYQRIGRPRDAIVQFNRAIELTPDNSWPYGNLGIAYMDFADPEMLDRAEKALKKSIAIGPTFGAYSNLALLYIEQRRFKESVSASLAAVQLNDQSYDVWDNLTIAYEWLKEDEKANAARLKAIGLLERDLETNSQDAVEQATLAALYAKQGDRTQALEKIKISLALSPNNQYVLSQVAGAYELMGSRREAIKFLQQAMTQGLTKGLLNVYPEIQGVLSDPGFEQPGI
jgi:serine/threonine protein kinase/tetratricopeptide (TPR) repeat protein